MSSALKYQVKIWLGVQLNLIGYSDSLLSVFCLVRANFSPQCGTMGFSNLRSFVYMLSKFHMSLNFKCLNESLLTCF